MRMAVFAALAAALALPAAARQEATLESVLAQMEKRLEGVRDVSLKVVTQADRQMGLMGKAEVLVTYVKGAGLRARASMEVEKEARGMMPIPHTIETIYSDDAVHFIQEWEGGPLPVPLAYQTYRIRKDDPGLRKTDVFFLPPGIPIRMMLEDPLVYYLLAPRLLLGLEPHLAYEGLRTEGGQSFHVLASASELGDPSAGRGVFLIDSRRKQFLVDAATGELRKIRWEVAARRGMTGRPDEKAVFTLEAFGSRKDSGTLGLPLSTRWTIVNEGSGGAQGRNQTMVRTFEAIRVNSGLAPESILSDQEKGDLYADALLRPAEEYETRAARDPKDASAYYSLAFARGIRDPFSMMGRAQAPKTDVSGVLGALEKALLLRPDSQSAAANLLSAVRTSGDKAAEKALLGRIAKGELRGVWVQIAGAASLAASGDVDGAGRLLEGLAPARESDRRRVALERLGLALLKGDEEALLRLFIEEAKRRPDEGDKLALVDSLDSRFESLAEPAKSRFTPAKLQELLDRAQKDDGAELAYPIARAAVLRRDGKPVAALVELLEAGPRSEALLARALRDAEAIKEWGPDEGARVAAALEKTDLTRPGIGLLRARALASAGKGEESEKALAQALEACRSETPGKPHHAAALRAAFQLAAERGPGDWREKCVGVILAIGKGSGAIPFEFVFDEGKNPVTQLALEFESRGEWMKFYTLSVEANRVFTNSYWMMRRTGPLKPEGMEAIRREVYKESDPARYMELVEFLEGLHDETNLSDVLAKAWEKAGKENTELHWKIAQSYARHGARENAVSAYEELIPRLAREKQDEARLELAEVHLKRGHPDQAKQLFGSVHLESLREDSVTRMIDLCGQAKDYDRGLEACARAYALGLKPHFQTGTFHEKKQNFYEALRYYNRDRLEPSSGGPEAALRKMERDMRRKMQKAERGKGAKEEEEEPENGEEARARLLKKLGPDYFVSKLLDQTPEPLGPAEDKRAKAALEKLDSEAIDDRDAGFAELKAIGPRCAPLLRRLLKSGDEEVKNRVRELLGEWAEPR